MSTFSHNDNVNSDDKADETLAITIKCLRGPAWLSGGVFYDSRGLLGFFEVVSFGKTLQSPSLVAVKPRKYINNVSSRRDMTEILLEAA